MPRHALSRLPPPLNPDLVFRRRLIPNTNTSVVFIALAVFIGNDFLPHLPDLHIQEHGLEKLFDVYMKVLPSLGK